MTVVLDSVCVRSALQEDCVKLHFFVSHPFLYYVRELIVLHQYSPCKDNVQNGNYLCRPLHTTVLLCDRVATYIYVELFREREAQYCSKVPQLSPVLGQTYRKLMIGKMVSFVSQYFKYGTTSMVLYIPACVPAY